MRGKFKRALELPDGQPVDVAPQGRARIRYNEATNTLQLSRDLGPWEDIATGGAALSADRLSYGSMPTNWTNTPYPLDGAELSALTKGAGGEEIYSNFSEYTRCQFRAVLGNGTEYDGLTFADTAAVIAWVNANVPNSGGTFDTQCRLFCYDIVDNTLSPLSIVFGRNANWARLREHYWGDRHGAAEASFSDWISSGDGDTALYNLWDEMWGSPLAALPWTDNERRCFWFPQNSKRTYDMPKPQAANRIPGRSPRYCLESGTGNRVPAGATNYFAWVGAASAFGYVAVDKDGNYQDKSQGWTRGIPGWLEDGWSVLVGYPLRHSATGNTAVMLKPLGIDQVYTEYVDPATHRIEFVAGSNRDKTRSMRIMTPVFNTPGQYSGPITIDQWWGACARNTGAYHTHSPGLGTGAFRIRDLSTNYVSRLSTARVKWLRRVRGRPLACVIGNKP